MRVLFTFDVVDNAAPHERAPSRAFGFEEFPFVSFRGFETFVYCFEVSRSGFVP